MLLSCTKNKSDMIFLSPASLQWSERDRNKPLGQKQDLWKGQSAQHQELTAIHAWGEDMNHQVTLPMQILWTWSHQTLMTYRVQCVTTVLRLQSHHEETVYFLPVRIQTSIAVLFLEHYQSYMNYKQWF